MLENGDPDGSLMSHNQTWVDASQMLWIVSRLPVESRMRESCTQLVTRFGTAPSAGQLDA
jgi:hypothetical protein